jgi:hypothetical protein
MDQNRWANALDEFWGDPEWGGRALFMLEPSLLMHVAELGGEEFESVDAAEADFLRAVNVYLRGRAAGPWYPEPYRPGMPPRFLLQAAVQVYAASKMADAADGDYTDRAYYVQLQHLVGDAGASERFNVNDQGEYHQVLWRVRLNEWAISKGLVLELPPDKYCAGRHVQLPKSQAALRIGDLERLPRFFSRCGFRPVDEDDPSAMLAQVKTVRDRLRRFRSDNLCFTSWAQRVLSDDRKFPIAAIQVEEALKTWDGRLHLRDAVLRKTNRSRPNHWVWISIITRRQALRVVAGASPTTGRVIDTESLSKLLASRTVGEARLHMRDGLAVFRYEEEENAFKQSEFLEAGDRALFIAGPNAWNSLDRILNEETIYRDSVTYTGDLSNEFDQLYGIPNGCFVTELHVVDPLPAVDEIREDWLQFLRTPRSGLWLGGGLRMDRKERWIAGAGPYLKISGSHLPTYIIVDGQRVNISGRIVRLDNFSTHGNHEIRAAFDGQLFVKQFSVGLPESSIGKEFPSRCWQFFDEQWPIFGASDSEVSDVDRGPRLSGVRGLGLAAQDRSPHSECDDRLVLIRLLAGFPFKELATMQSQHPLARHLIKQELHRERQKVTS